MPNPAADRFLRRSRYYLGVEYPTKIRQAVQALPDDRLWWRPHEQANSAANLLLHLAGNIRQWVCSGIGRADDVRHRDEEFAATETSGWSREQLLEHFERACADAVAVIDALDAAELTAPRAIQGRETDVLSALYHVVEHCAGHAGQLILLAKWFAPGRIAFYDDRDGLARPRFLPGVDDQAD